MEYKLQLRFFVFGILWKQQPALWISLLKRLSLLRVALPLRGYDASRIDSPGHDLGCFAWFNPISHGV